MPGEDENDSAMRTSNILNHYVAACVIAFGFVGNATVLLYLLLRKLCCEQIFGKFDVTLVLLLVDNILVLLVFFAEQVVPFFGFLHGFLPLNIFVRQLAVVYVPVLEILYSFDACLSLLLAVERWIALSDQLELKKLLTPGRYCLSLFGALSACVVWHLMTYFANRSIGESSRYVGLFSTNEFEPSTWTCAFYYATLTVTLIAFEVLPFSLMQFLVRRTSSRHKQRSQSAHSAPLSHISHPDRSRDRDVNQDQDGCIDETKRLPFLVAKLTAHCFSLEMLAHGVRVALEFYRLSISFQSDKYYSFGVCVTNLSIIVASSLHLLIYLRAYCAQPLESFGYFKTDSEENFELALARSDASTRHRFLRVSSY